MRARRAQGLQIKKKLKTGAKRAGPDNDYGMVDEDAPEPLEVLEHMKDDFIKNLSRMTAEDRFQLQKSTTLQVDRSIWMTERRKRLSASNHGDVCHMRPYTSCKRLVHSILYGSVCTPDMVNGRKMEEVAKDHLRCMGYKVEPSGLYVDEEFPYLSASPGNINVLCKSFR